MNLRPVFGGVLLLCINMAAAACEQPALIAIPAIADIGDGSAQLIVAMQRYFSGTKEYLACIQAELSAAGGDAAPQALRNVLIRRNNAAVAETEAVVALFTERVAPMRELYLAEFIAGPGEECISTVRMESTAVVDDLAVLFIERSGRAHLNVLEALCQNLERYGYFMARRNVAGTSRGGIIEPDRGVQNELFTSRLCSREFIYPYQFEGSTARSDECALGKFFELTAEQVTRLTAVGAATQSEAEPGTSQGGAETKPGAE